MGSLRSSDIQTPVAITVRQVMDVAKTSQPVPSFLSLFFQMWEENLIFIMRYLFLLHYNVY